MVRSIEVAISDGLAALSRMQSPDGSFPLWTGTAGWRPCGPLFSTAYVMMGAGKRLGPEAAAKAANYIREQRGPDGLWEFDKAMDLPPDSDATACALAALCRVEGPEGLAGDAGLLREFWRSPTGPFRTWKMGPLSGPERDDPVVNCNVLFALRMLGKPPTQAEAASVYSLLSRTLGSRYYCFNSTIAHAAARADLDLSFLPPAISSPPPLDRPFQLIEWLCTGRSEPRLVETVLGLQKEDGAWPIYPWVMAQTMPRRFWGSPAVSTALAVEGLSRAAGLGEA